MKELATGIYIIEGSVNGGALIHGRHALLIDMPETVHPEGVVDEIRSAGADIIDMVLLTQGRRNFCGGLFQYNGPVLVAASLEEAEVLRTAGDVWRSKGGLFHRYELFPDHLLPFENCSAAVILADGDVREWNEFTITCITVGAQSAGEMIYVVNNKETGRCYAFCGSFAMAGGRIAELDSFQKALPGMMGYHGHMAGLIKWKIAAERLKMMHPDVLIPAYGPVDEAPACCIDLLEERLTAYARNYVGASAVRYYFPEEFRKGFEIPMGIQEGPEWAEIREHPRWLARIGETTSYLIRSESNHAILIDAGDKEAVDYVKKLADEEGLALDGLWITHYHDDHLNAINEFIRVFEAAQSETMVMTTISVAQVMMDPDGYHLPATCDIKVVPKIVKDGETWEWEGFRLTAVHYPAQSLHHAGLFVEKDDDRVLMCGDGFAPTGFDDYCPYNRNLPGEGRGYRLCLDFLKDKAGVNIVNEHQTEPFAYDGEYLRFLSDNLDKRDELLAELLPEGAGFGLDPYWVRIYPASQKAKAGETVELAVQVTGHGEHEVEVRLRVPWKQNCGEDLLQDRQTIAVKIKTTGITSGSTLVESKDVPRDYEEIIELAIPEDEHGEIFIPADCFIDGHYIGSRTYAGIVVADTLPGHFALS